MRGATAAAVLFLLACGTTTPEPDDTDTTPEDCEALSTDACEAREGCRVARVHPYAPGEPGGYDPDGERVDLCVTMDETDCADMECTFQQPGGDCYVFPNSCRPVGWGDCPGVQVCGMF